MSRHQRCFPVAALRQLAIAGYHEDAPFAAIFFRRQRQTHRDRQSVAERTGIQLHARGFLPHRMARQVRIRVLIGRQPVDGKIARLRQHAVVTADGMTF